ncbi:SGNH/GDSL hydrolase family protein [Rhodococcus aetherivorans]|nr:SGNH/GDSL hydrolase family protein [Rhodococcus aetherivorans]MDV6291441.1 SGNH/GDSL hydrolase family protein [Rhodococcus aetherivorans]NGP25960.1 SGNH/GDSL hydrolase family protein [Rhodococcus aetherivorans]UGQ39411.1 SGNH/GDSL hydrolase family protein [Rhodococcus aetherivorans]
MSTGGAVTTAACHRRMRRRLGAVAAASLTVLATACTDPGSPADSAPEPGPAYSSYVALGDSFTAGPMIPPQIDSACARSGSNYPHAVAETLGIDNFRDASCSSATTANLTGPQVVSSGATVPAQYDALTPETELVTVGIGGNDIGLVALAGSCLALDRSSGRAAAPAGPLCATANVRDGLDLVDRAIDDFAPTYGVIVREIRNRAPDARILLVGYPTGIRDGGCYPDQPILPDDATYLQAKIDRLNTAMEQQADAAGVDYVDLRESTVGHDACQPSAQRWTEGLFPSQPAAPLHPNADGHRNAAEQVLVTIAD